MANSKVYQPAGWKHIRSAYAEITRKLNRTQDKDKRLADISYCISRLAEDYAAILAGHDALNPPADEPED